MTLRLIIYKIAVNDVIIEQMFVFQYLLLHDKFLFISNELSFVLFVLLLESFRVETRNDSHLLDCIDFSQLVHILKTAFVSHYNY